MKSIVCKVTVTLVLVLAATAAVGAGTTIFPVDPDTLASFELNGDSSDSSGNGRHATLLGGEFVSTHYGQGLHVLFRSFQGVPQPMGLDWSGFASLLVHPYTIEMVLTPKTTDCFHKLFSFEDNDDGGWYYCDGFAAYPNPNIGGSQLPSDLLHYLAVVSTAADQVDVYFQGALLGSTGAAFAAPPPEIILFQDDTATGRSEQIDAVIDAVRISQVARSAQEIAALWSTLPLFSDGFETGDTSAWAGPRVPECDSTYQSAFVFPQGSGTGIRPITAGGTDWVAFVNAFPNHQIYARNEDDIVDLVMEIWYPDVFFAGCPPADYTYDDVGVGLSLVEEHNTDLIDVDPLPDGTVWIRITNKSPSAGLYSVGDSD